ncbi:hypothetical protein B0T20DRAFT_371516 [Sordaria brevicollis]|uniref:Uncharacterized protein n=1 Tax=Sordaria brevicollis TaxID=83679 RepID=A0AAE0PJ79_SORBR|nr:hypothetical protein B0T20DRAFT_371516 [Sordaria brevicollis]
MPRQNTFTIVPNALGMQGLIARDSSDSSSSRPKAMTSKQAKKLYKQATKQPKLSKAEQRRLELEEQERIRKELDKQKSANKARLAREKKKAKELAEKEARRKRGLPLVDVHPSQDTISRFVRVGFGNAGAGVKRDVGGNVKSDNGEGQSKAVPPERDGANKENVPNGGAEVGEGPRKRPRLDEGSQSARQDAGMISTKEDIQRMDDNNRPSKPRNTPQAQPKLRDENGASVNLRDDQPRQPVKEVPRTNGAAKTGPSSSKDRIQSSEEIVMLPLPKPIRTHPDRHLEDMGLSRPRTDKHVSQPKGQEAPASKPAPARKVINRLPTGMRARPALGETHGNRSTPSNLAKEMVPPEGDKNRAVVNQVKQQQESQENSQPKLSNSTPKPAVVVAAVGATKPLPPPQPHASPMPPPQRPTTGPSPNPAKSTPPVAQYPAVAPANSSKPLSTASNPSKFASPYRSMGPPAFVPQRPSPGPSRFRKPTVSPSNGGIQKPRFLPRNHPTTSARASPSGSIGRSAVPSNNAPPTSTQLFVMSHLDDLLPSPSQELRELEENIQPTPVSRPPVFKPSSLEQGPPTAMATKSALAPGPRRFVRQTSNVQIAPPQPRMQPVEDDFFPFLSTQDLLFSSQDIRELESGTPSKADTRKEPLRPPSLKSTPNTTTSSPPIISNNGHGPSQLATATPGPNSVVLSQKPPEEAHPSSNPSQRTSTTSTPKATPALGQNPTNNSSPTLPPIPPTPAAPERAPAPPPQSPPRTHWFGSSGVGIQILLAAAESKKTFKEDEERRQEKARRARVAEERRKRKAAAEAKAKQEEEAKKKKAAEERARELDRIRRQGEEIARMKMPSARTPSIVKPVGQGNHAQQASPVVKAAVEAAAAAAGQGNSQVKRQPTLAPQPQQQPQVTKTSSTPRPKSSIAGQYQIPQPEPPEVPQMLPPPPASQETDYGDDDIEDTLGELGLPGGIGLTQFLGPDRDLSWLDEDDIDDF